MLPQNKPEGQQSDLGLNVATNGTLWAPKTVAELAQVAEEARVSALADNHCRPTFYWARDMIAANRSPAKAVKKCYTEIAWAEDQWAVGTDPLGCR